MRVPQILDRWIVLSVSNFGEVQRSNGGTHPIVNVPRATLDAAKLNCEVQAQRAFLKARLPILFLSDLYC